MSLIRENLMERPGYSPYCGSERCPLSMPRTKFDGAQFRCACGWRSDFDAEFIAQYKVKWSIGASAPTEERPVMRNSRTRMALLAMAGLAASAAMAVPVVRAPEPKAESSWDGGGRKRAQWKSETNKRGRNR